VGGPACLEVRIAHGSLDANPRSAAAADPRVNDRCRVSREKLAGKARPSGVARQPTVIIRRQQLIGQVPCPADIYRRTDIPPILDIADFSLWCTAAIFCILYSALGGSVAEWLACWTQTPKARVQIAVATLSGNSIRQTVHTHCAFDHQAAKLAATLLRVAGVTAGLAESNGSLPPGL